MIHPVVELGKVTEWGKRLRQVVQRIVKVPAAVFFQLSLHVSLLFQLHLFCRIPHEVVYCLRAYHLPALSKWRDLG